jgi:hypothetical protein
MNRKFLAFSLLAVISVVALVVLSAVTVFALMGDSQAQVEKVRTDEVIELTPGEVVESNSQPQIVEPVRRYEYVNSSGQAGHNCFSAKEQLTEAAPDQKPENQVLTLAE